MEKVIELRIEKEGFTKDVVRTLKKLKKLKGEI